MAQSWAEWCELSYSGSLSVWFACCLTDGKLSDDQTVKQNEVQKEECVNIIDTAEVENL